MLITSVVVFRQCGAHNFKRRDFCYKCNTNRRLAEGKSTKIHLQTVFVLFEMHVINIKNEATEYWKLLLIYKRADCKTDDADLLYFTLVMVWEGRKCKLSEHVRSWFMLWIDYSTVSSVSWKMTSQPINSCILMRLSLAKNKTKKTTLFLLIYQTWGRMGRVVVVDCFYTAIFSALACDSTWVNSFL